MTESSQKAPFLTRKRAILVFLLILALRVAVAAQFRGNFDSQSFLFAAQLAAHGDNVYAGTNRYNYSPLWSYVLAGIWTVSNQNVHLFVLLLGLLQIGVDVIAAMFVWRIAGGRLGFSSSASHRAALLFFSNPISVQVSSCHGQVDGTAVLCLLAAIYWAMGPEFRERRFRIVLLLGLSLLVKHVTAFHPILFWRRLRRPGLSDVEVTIPYAIFFLSFLPFAAAWQPIIRNVFLYSAGVEHGKVRPGGLRSFIEFSDYSNVFFAILCLVSVAGFIWISRKMELTRASLVLFLGLLVFLPSYGGQYIVWPVALGSLYASPAYGLYSAVGAVWHFTETWGLRLPVQLSPYAAWLAAIVWLVGEVRRPQSPRQPIL
jgi:hypothetical protein